jgi:acyl-coenzyme A synthetase/AMP-(fatty) acid ligase
MANMTDYDATHSQFTLDVPEYFNYTTDVVDTWASQDPNARALVAVAADGSAKTYTIGQIADWAARASSALLNSGIRHGDRVFVQLPRTPIWYAVVLGCFRIGAIPMPATTQLTGQDIEYRIRASDAIAAVTDVDGAKKTDDIAEACPTLRIKFVAGGNLGGWTNVEAAFADALAPGGPSARTRATDPLLIYFTSGTTAHPKMVQHTHASLGIGHEITARFWHDLTPTDLHWTVSDFGWAKAAWGKLFGAWRLRASLFLWDIQGKPDYDRMVRLISEHGVTSFCAPPTIYRSLVQLPLEQYDWSSLRHCTAAGEPLNPEVIAAWKRATGRDIFDGYGQTESVCLVANYPCLPVRPGSMGKPTPGFVVDIVDDEGIVLAPGQEGNIAVQTDPRPVGLFDGYWRDDDRTRSVFRHGWYYTGDRGTKDTDGYFWFVGRADDVILSAGYRIGPFEVESALLEHPAVVEAAVVGKPDEQRGEIVKAYVITAAGYAPSPQLVAELQRHARTVTAPYKYPREIEFVDELPKTVSGKIRRVDLRDRAREELNAPSAVP